MSAKVFPIVVLPISALLLGLGFLIVFTEDSDDARRKIFEILGNAADRFGMYMQSKGGN
jgi:phosphotransferase system  glucose/maltose/N-acetylglucosamine-specific IIC component